LEQDEKTKQDEPKDMGDLEDGEINNEEEKGEHFAEEDPPLFREEIEFNIRANPNISNIEERGLFAEKFINTSSSARLNDLRDFIKARIGDQETPITIQLDLSKTKNVRNSLTRSNSTKSQEIPLSTNCEITCTKEEKYLTVYIILSLKNQFDHFLPN
jgi:hypothetical protein